MKYENFKEVQSLVEKIDKYKKIIENTERVTCDVDRSYIDTHLTIKNIAANSDVSSVLEIEVMTCEFAQDLLEQYKEHAQRVIDESIKKLEQL